MQVSRELRKVIYDKAAGHCWYCGLDLHPFGDWQIDHQHPVSHGGSDAPENLVAACRQCNRRKGARDVAQYRRHLMYQLEHRLFDTFEFITDFVEGLKGLPSDRDLYIFAEIKTLIAQAHGLSPTYTVVFYGEKLPLLPVAGEIQPETEAVS